MNWKRPPFRKLTPIEPTFNANWNSIRQLSLFAYSLLTNTITTFAEPRPCAICSNCNNKEYRHYLKTSFYSYRTLHTLSSNTGYAWQNELHNYTVQNLTDVTHHSHGLVSSLVWCAQSLDVQPRGEACFGEVRFDSSRIRPFMSNQFWNLQPKRILIVDIIPTICISKVASHLSGLVGRKKTGFSQLKWKVQGAGVHFTPKLSKFPRCGRPEQEN